MKLGRSRRVLMRSRDLTSSELAKFRNNMELMDLEWAPCRWACPVHADVRKYIECAAQGRFGDAIDVIREKLAFAGVCGRVCHHPCEANCRRQDVDEPIAIRELKRFVAELAGAGAAPAKDGGRCGATVHREIGRASCRERV